MTDVPVFGDPEFGDPEFGAQLVNAPDDRTPPADHETAAERAARQPRGPKSHSAEDARQGQIVLRKTWQRVVFFGGLILVVLFALVFGR